MLEFESNDEDAFPHSDITRAIIGAAFEVHNQLGYGYLHRIYQNALQVELIQSNRVVELEKRINVYYKGAMIGYYDADAVVENCVLVEIKIAPQYDKCDEAELSNVLKATGLKVG